MTRRKLLHTAMLGAPAALSAATPQADSPSAASRPMKITKIEVLHLEKPLKERFWMANSPIGGFDAKASWLIVTLHTDAGISGHGEGSGGGAALFRKGFADLLMGEDPFMVGKIWEKMFAVTYGREPSTRGWDASEVIAAMAPMTPRFMTSLPNPPACRSISSSAGIAIRFRCMSPAVTTARARAFRN